MGRLEDSLRETFASQVKLPPSTDGLADRAIVGAARVRRRRLAVASVAASVCVALIAVGSVWLARGRENGAGPTAPSVSSWPTPTAIPVDPVLPVSVQVRVGPNSVGHGDQVIMGGGGRAGFAQVAAGLQVGGIWQVDGGWLLKTQDYGPDSSGAGPTDDVWWVPEMGTPSKLASGIGVAVGPGGSNRPGVQIAWVSQEKLSLGTLRDGRLAGVVSTNGMRIDIGGGGSRILTPQAIVGDAVVLAASQTGGGPDIWDSWAPSRGQFHQSFSAQTGNPGGFSTLLSTTPLNGHVIGTYLQGGSKGSCLGEFDTTLQRTRSACPNPLGDIAFGVFPSPSGKWWVVAGVDGSLSLYDAAQVWNGATPVRTWTVDHASGVEWLDDGRFAVVNAKSVRTLGIDGSVRASFDLPTDVLEARLVPDLRSR